jgi:hypothetical protein
MVVLWRGGALVIVESENDELAVAVAVGVGKRGRQGVLDPLVAILHEEIGVDAGGDGERALPGLAVGLLLQREGGPVPMVESADDGDGLRLGGRDVGERDRPRRERIGKSQHRQEANHRKLPSFIAFGVAP